jgi:hypothetical protein
MPNNSATGGYLLPAVSPAPLEGQALFRFLQQIFVNITGLPGTVFFPRWQLEPENLPAVGTDWAAFGVTSRRNNKFQFEQHQPAVVSTPGYNEFQTHEELEILVSFYSSESGNADMYAALLRDGIYLSQNREQLLLNNMGLIDTGDLTAVPSLVKAQWLYRIDLPVRIRRQIVRRYTILDVDSFDGTVYTDEPPLTIPIDVVGP